MKERQIIFSGEMVKAILDGQKTQTRRVMKLQPDCRGALLLTAASQLWYTWPHITIDGQMSEYYCNCPYYGQPGDRLWVKETWALNHPILDAKVRYRADLMSPDLGKPWKPSIFMPRWASRITLEVVKVRVERVQEIKPMDAIAEGAIQWFMRNGMNWEHSDKAYPVYSFQQLWNSINTKRGYGWEVNPWVWVIEFKRVEKGDENR